MLPMNKCFFFFCFQLQTTVIFTQWLYWQNFLYWLDWWMAGSSENFKVC